MSCDLIRCLYNILIVVLDGLVIYFVVELVGNCCIDLSIYCMIGILVRELDNVEERIVFFDSFKLFGCDVEWFLCLLCWSCEVGWFLMWGCFGYNCDLENVWIMFKFGFFFFLCCIGFFSLGLSCLVEFWSYICGNKGFDLILCFVFFSDI